MMSKLARLMPVSCLQDSSLRSNPANHWQVSKPPLAASRHWAQARQGCGLQMLSRSAEERKKLISPFCRKFVASFSRESHPEPAAAPPAVPSPSPLQCQLNLQWIWWPQSKAVLSPHAFTFSPHTFISCPASPYPSSYRLSPFSLSSLGRQRCWNHFPARSGLSAADSQGCGWFGHFSSSICEKI